MLGQYNTRHTAIQTQSHPKVGGDRQWATNRVISKFHCVPEVRCHRKRKVRRIKRREVGSNRAGEAGYSRGQRKASREGDIWEKMEQERAKWICRGRAFQTERSASAKALRQQDQGEFMGKVYMGPIWESGKRMVPQKSGPSSIWSSKSPSPPDSLSHRPSQAMRPAPHEERLYLIEHIPFSLWTWFHISNFSHQDSVF